MLMRRHLRLLATGVLLLSFAQPSVLGDDKDKSRQRIDNAKRLWDVDQMLEEHCDCLAMHYNLDSSQKGQTRKLLVGRVNKFLDRHDKEIWPLMLELTELSYAGKTPDQAQAKRIASKGYNIFLEAKAEILRSQDVFREYLNDDQKKIHDRDLKGLDYAFNALDRQFQDWRAGKVRGRAPLSNVRLAGGQPLLPRRGTASMARHETEWEKYVIRFIADYGLDEEQRARALAILKDIQDKAAKYRKANEKELQEANKYYNDSISVIRSNPGQLEEAKMILELLKKPLNDLFVELKARLEAIPTEQQKAAYYKRHPNRRPPGAPESPSAQPEKKSTTDKSTTPGKGSPVGSEADKQKPSAVEKGKPGTTEQKKEVPKEDAPEKTPPKKDPPPSPDK